MVWISNIESMICGIFFMFVAERFRKEIRRLSRAMFADAEPSNLSEGSAKQHGYFTNVDSSIYGWVAWGCGKAPCRPYWCPRRVPPHVLTYATRPRMWSDRRRRTETLYHVSYHIHYASYKNIKYDVGYAFSLRPNETEPPALGRLSKPCQTPHELGSGSACTIGEFIRLESNRVMNW